MQHVGHVPESLPVTEETRERLREQANQLPEPTVLRLIDLLAIAVDDMRQGGDPRLPLELALVKITRPQADLSRDSLAHRLELLEARPHGGAHRCPRRQPRAVPRRRPRPAPPRRRRRRPLPAPRTRPQRSRSTLPPLELDQLRDAWQRDVVDAVRDRSIPISTLVAEARPVEIRGDTVTIEFAPAAGFHRTQIEDPKNLALLREALYEVTGRRLTVETVVGASPRAGRAGRRARALRGGRDLAAQGHLRCRGSGGALMAKFDMNAMLKQAQQMQAQMLEAQEQAKQEIVEASAGGGMVTVKANGGGEIVEIRIDPKAIDPDDPGDARRHRDGGGERGAALGERAGRVEDPGPDARSRGAGAARPVAGARGVRGEG